MNTGSIVVHDLRCEYRANPLAVDVTEPRLSWVLESSERGQVQTAYHVLVSSSEQGLAVGKGDLWDSGEVRSDQSVHVVYAGSSLESRQSCHWKVRVWDKDGNPSEWSRPAFWSMGLLAASDWTAGWIGLDEGEDPDHFADAKWIWHPADSEPGTAMCFRRAVIIPSGCEISAARLTMGGRCRFTVSVNGDQIVDGARAQFAPTCEVDVDQYLRPGSNAIAIAATRDGGEGPSGLICALSVDIDSRESIVVRSDAGWKTSQQLCEGWDRPDFDDSGWVAAQELGANDGSVSAKVLGDDNRRLPARMLRREFIVDRAVRRATVYVCGLGLSELHINGKKIGDHVLSPGLTDYNKRALYVTYDVTSNLRLGANAVGVMLGNGRYFAPRKVACSPAVNYGYPKLLLQMEIEYDDGSLATVLSNDSWMLTTNGPIRANNEYDGEVYDARKEMDGWSEPGFASGPEWQAARLVEGPKGVMNSEIAEPIRVVDTVSPVAVTSPKSGVYVFDMGQNMVGWCRLRVKGPGGTRVRLRHAETLNDDGTLQVSNLRTARCTDVYILHGKGTEVYEPRFVYHGFRFVEVTGYPGEPGLDALEGMVVGDSIGRAGEFSCSNALINKIYHSMYWGIRGNYKSIPLDCPQRDERQGWLGDRCEVSRGEMYIFNTAALNTKWLRDIDDSQLDDGSIPDLAPAFWSFYSKSVLFPSAFVSIPGYLYSEYADTRVLETCYESMANWVEMTRAVLSDYTLPRETYGDWCAPPESRELIHATAPNLITNPEMVSTAYFYHDLRLMAGYAAILGKTSDARGFSELADKIRAGFNARFFNESAGIYDNGTQTSSILPLAFGLVPDQHRQRVFANLVENISVQTHGHIGTGMVGCKWIMRVLTDNGRLDMAYRLATQTSYPSWGYMVGSGATTIWELWNGDAADPAMNSGNHVMQIGDLCIWLHEYLAGIAPDETRPGFKHIIMRPHAVADMRSAKAYHKSVYGTIVSDWKMSNGEFIWRIEVPVNTTATVHIPAAEAAAISESGKPVADAKEIRFVGMENGRAVLEIGSGRYSFVSADLPGKAPR